MAHSCDHDVSERTNIYNYARTVGVVMYKKKYTPFEWFDQVQYQHIVSVVA